MGFRCCVALASLAAAARAGGRQRSRFARLGCCSLVILNLRRGVSARRRNEASMIVSILAKLISIKPLVRTLGGVVYGMFVFVGTVNVPAASGQTSSGFQQAVRPEFEVASVKPCSPDTVRGTNAGMVSAGRVSLNCQTLVSYLQLAYANSALGGPDRVEGGPTWVEKEPYQITAKAAGAASLATTQGPMMQALLEDRFKLKAHKEIREVKAYALVAANGRRPPAAKTPCFTRSPEHPFPRPEPGQPFPTICGFNGIRNSDGIQIRGSTMAEFCMALSKTPVNLDSRKFIDQTGITGRFDFDLKFPYPELPLEQGDPAAPRFPPEDFTNLQGALLKLGLKLAPTKTSAEFVVIDHAERPTPN